MKKLLAVVLALSFVFSLVACSSNDTANNQSVDSSSRSESTMSYGAVDEKIVSSFSDLSWPEFGIASLLPVPSWCKTGVVCVNSQYGFTAYLANTSKNQFDSYAKSLYEAGYVLDYVKSPGYFGASSDDDKTVVIKYFDDNIMYVYLWDVSIDDEEEIDE